MTKKKSMIFAKTGLFLVLGLSSFADETAQVTFALHLAKSTASISMPLVHHWLRQSLALQFSAFPSHSSYG
ncbi:hypothetical protein GGR09_001636 [Bartonella heixiaziensis]